ncbi:blood vessel epicardial substance-B-like isoform X1 [Aplysia californica]|uniref:Blood vessel epicardial substance-B-like isoform X1 n=1 Tax=Aplysia californica TaxID=6500 RepID=A0ABM1A229_APLCA|nr:blood vessel epicardial substance-B-like isoform X1 [Aplysia californica]
MPIVPNVSTSSNQSSVYIDPVVDTNYVNLTILETSMETLIGCSSWQPTNHVLYHLANGVLCLGLLVPDSNYGALLLHGLMFLGFLLMSIWSWVILCAPDFFSWNFAFLILNGIQTFSLMYSIRPVKFCDELEDVYVNMFLPLRVSRQLYKRLVCPEFCTLMTLHEGESYATQSVTRTDKLGLLISGTMNAYSNRSLLHTVTEKQFIDSPEFESTTTGDEKFQVSIIAAGMCRYLFWPRQSLEYLLIKEPYLACVMKTVIGRDITNKLYALNEKVATPAGSRLDIRLPSLPATARQRRDLRRALIGAMGGESDKTTPRHLARVCDKDSDTEKQSDAEETDAFLPKGTPQSAGKVANFVL